MHKICTKCHEQKDPHEFNTRRSICKSCQSLANKAYHAAHRAARLAAHKAWIAAHRDEIQAYNAAHIEARRASWQRSHLRHLAKRQEASRQYKRAHREESRAYSREYLAAHRDDIYTKKRAHRLVNYEATLLRERAAYRRTQEKRRAYQKAFSQTHPDYARTHRRDNPLLYRAKDARRHARIRGAGINDLTAAQWEEICAAYDYRCVYCPSTCQECRRRTHTLTKDHIDPVVKGGNHTYANIVPACLPCNQKKFIGPPLKPVQPLLLTIIGLQPVDAAGIHPPQRKRLPRL